MQSRNQSIDILRGLTVAMMIMVNTPGSWSYVYAPLLHAKWHGCTPTDMVFPSFIFVMGMSMYFSLHKVTNTRGAIIKILKRASLIFLIGLLLNWFPFVGRSIEELRIFGVLQRIACAFLLAGLVITLIRKTTWLAISAVLLMISHYCILYSFGDHSLGGDWSVYSLEGNVGTSIDRWLVGEPHMYGGFGIKFDPEGLLGTLSSGAQVILGYLASKFVLSKKIDAKLCFRIAMAGVVSIFTAWILSHVVPINKPLWTPSYVLYTSGYLLIIWSLIMWIADVKSVGSWSFPFKVFGRNALISYVLSILFAKIMLYVIHIEESSLYAWLYANVFQSACGNYLGSLLFALSVVASVWICAYILYRKDIIVKV